MYSCVMITRLMLVRALVLALVLLALLTATHQAHLALRTALQQQQSHAGAYQHAILPSSTALSLMSLGYKEMWADYYWLRAISHFGDEAMHPYNYPDLLPLMQRVLTLDPYFGGAYYFAGTALTLQGMKLAPVMTLLRQGMQYRPDLWFIPYLLGFNAFYFLGDYPTAAQAMAQAAAFPDAPPETGPLATRLAAEAGLPEVGIKFIDRILPSISDAKLRATYEERRRLLQLEVDIAWLNQAVQRFREKTGRTPTSLTELVHHGDLQYVPTDPMGGTYSLDHAGHVQTTTTRLHLVPEGKKLP